MDHIVKGTACCLPNLAGGRPFILVQPKHRAVQVDIRCMNERKHNASTLFQCFGEKAVGRAIQLVRPAYVASFITHPPLALTYSCPAEISPNPDNFLLGRFLRVEIPSLPCGPVIHLRAIQKSNHNISIIEMRYTAGENLVFCPLAKGINFYGSYITL
jgi:hypothetical protein